MTPIWLSVFLKAGFYSKPYISAASENSNLSEKLSMNGFLLSRSRKSLIKSLPITGVILIFEDKDYFSR